jgi:Trk-type K+ transport system membrane component
MSWLRRPEVWLPLALLILTGVGGSLLTQDRFVHLSERDRGSYGLRPVWQARFDALSATCGVGLLTYKLNEDYTPSGRWVLVGLGVAGTLLYLGAARQAIGRLWPGGALPRMRTILGAYAAAQMLVIGLALLGVAVSEARTPPEDTAWNALSAFSSLGWLRETPGVGHAWIYAGIALLSALGWPIWVCVWRRALPRGRLLLALGGYCGFLIACAALMAALETPRAVPVGRQAAPDDRPENRLEMRCGRAIVQVLAASGAGIPTEKLKERGVSDGTKAVLAGVVLVGGLGGSGGGGIKWIVLCWALAAGRASLTRQPGRTHNELARRCLLVGTASAALFLILVLVVACGLLLIESHVGSTYQSAPTFADALLDASSAVAGANLSSGLTATVTNLNLSTGIRQSVDLYQYGMVWLMLAMFIGRVLPLLVIGHVARLRFDDAPATLPPLI